MSLPLETIIQITGPQNSSMWLDLIAAIMVEAGIKEVKLPAATEYKERLCIMNREDLQKSPGYDIHLCESSEAAFALGDSLHGISPHGKH